MNILFYTPVNFRCRDIESLAKKYLEEGNTVFLLSTSEIGSLHYAFSEMGAGVATLSSAGKSSLFGTLQSIKGLIKFCRENKIDLLFSHLEPTNFIAVLAQYFIKARVVIYRHHVDLAKLLHFEKSFTYKLTYRLAKDIISVSEEGKQYMIDYESVAPGKIESINLGYDFSRYGDISKSNVDLIRQEYRRDLLLVTAGSLIHFKRQELSIELVYRAKNNGINTSLLVLGIGNDLEKLIDLVKKYDVGDRVFFVGYKENILDYFSASDFLIHPSLSESSCVVVKEAALAELPVITCRGVGDFDNYLVNKVNGITVGKENFVAESLHHIEKYLVDPHFYKTCGANLKTEIIRRFSIESVFSRYSKYGDK